MLVVGSIYGNAGDAVNNAAGLLLDVFAFVFLWNTSDSTMRSRFPSRRQISFLFRTRIDRGRGEKQRPDLRTQDQSSEDTHQRRNEQVRRPCREIDLEW